MKSILRSDGGRDLHVWPPDFDGWSAIAKPSDVNATYTRIHKWSIRQESLEWELEIPVATYEYCTNRYRTNEYGRYIIDPFQQPVIESLANRITDFCLSRREIDQLTAAIRFVQSLEYSLDIDDTGYRAYPKYATETLVHQRGDCEDGTLLLGTILSQMDYDVAMLVLPDVQHMMLGVACEDATGTSIEYEGRDYYVVETTGHGWDVGEWPQRYRTTKTELHFPADLPVLVHQWEAAPRKVGQVDVEAHVANFGDAIAEGVRAQIEFERRDGQTVAQRLLSRDPVMLDVGEFCQLKTTVSLPPDRTLRGRCQIVENGFLHDESISSWK